MGAGTCLLPSPSFPDALHTYGVVSGHGPRWPGPHPAHGGASARELHERLPRGGSSLTPPPPPPAPSCQPEVSQSCTGVPLGPESPPTLFGSRGGGVAVVSSTLGPGLEERTEEGEFRAPANVTRGPVGNPGPRLCFVFRPTCHDFFFSFLSCKLTSIVIQALLCVGSLTRVRQRSSVTSQPLS